MNTARIGVTTATHSQPTRWARVTRGAAGAAFATFTAAFSHVAAGGLLPSAAAFALTLALSTLVCIALAGRSLSLWRTSAGVAVSQFLFHGIFSQVVSSGSVALSPLAGHDHSSSLIATAVSGATIHTVHPSWMWLAHATAALLTVVMLRHGEAALRDLAGAIALFLAPLTDAGRPHLVQPSRRTPRVGCARSVVPRDLSALFSALRHRGPPRCAFI